MSMASSTPPSTGQWLLLATATILLLLLVACESSIVMAQSDNHFNEFPHHQQFGAADNQHHQQPNGRSLLDYIGLGTGSNLDPYLARTNAACLNGELAECFKSQALNAFSDFFSKESYELNENVRVIRMPRDELRSIQQEPYEYSSEPRSTDSEWEHLVKFALRKIEKFLKSTALEIEVPRELTESGRYSPRFVDEIADEIDIIEDKKDTIFSRKRLRKLFIPFLIVLKLFKLKLLLFLPLILGLASFKKLLAFLAIVIPGVIGFLRLCSPTLGQNSYHVPQYSVHGLGALNGNNNLYNHLGGGHQQFHNGYAGGYHGNSVSFREDAHDIAYSGYNPQYRSAQLDKNDTEVKSSGRKSILPDS